MGVDDHRVFSGKRREKEMTPSSFDIRRIQEKDSDWIIALTEKEWGAQRVVTRGIVHDVSMLDGFVAVRGEERIGLITFHIDRNECEIVTLNSLSGGEGVASSLIVKVKEVATKLECKRLWLITTNDNTAALRFYQKRGFSLVVIYRGALEQSRRLKPEIPMVGIDGIPLRDEIELEMDI
jgi:ribosomal protein S18 acetylase RimI-like enzyme